MQRKNRSGRCVWKVSGTRLERTSDDDDDDYDDDDDDDDDDDEINKVSAR